MSAHRMVAAVAIFAVAVSCVVPASREEFIKKPSENGLYGFCLDFTDSLASYDLYLVSRFDVKNSILAGKGDIPLELTFVSPQLDISREKIYFPLDRPVVNRMMRKEYVHLYRSSMKSYGVWLMTLRVEDGFSLPEGFCGFGMKFKKSEK